MARTNDVWETGPGGTYIQTIGPPSGYDLLINGANHYINFDVVSGSTGYGIRDNGGTMQYKDSAGSWTSFSAGGGSPPFYIAPSTPFLIAANAPNQTLIGTDGLGNPLISNVGSVPMFGVDASGSPIIYNGQSQYPAYTFDTSLYNPAINNRNGNLGFGFDGSYNPLLQSNSGNPFVTYGGNTSNGIVTQNITLYESGVDSGDQFLYIYMNGSQVANPIDIIAQGTTNVFHVDITGSIYTAGFLEDYTMNGHNINGVNTLNFQSIYDYGSQGVFAIDWTLAEIIRVEATGGLDISFVNPSPAYPCHRQLIVINNTGPITTAWSGPVVNWMNIGSVAPNMVGSGEMVISLVWDGTTWRGTWGATA